MDRQLFAVLQEQIKADLDLSDSQLALLGGTMFAVFYATLGLPIAFLADRTNRVRLIALACAAWSVFTALSGAASNFLTMALARIGVATGAEEDLASFRRRYAPPERIGRLGCGDGLRDIFGGTILEHTNNIVGLRGIAIRKRLAAFTGNPLATDQVIENTRFRHHRPPSSTSLCRVPRL